ncbi:MAG: hypothetical protein E6R13_05355 [Spirochaetes bacterium]|nr:MAG: hypothetical protein E6R13_05355 [Spirochaetota bacterium]
MKSKITKNQLINNYFEYFKDKDKIIININIDNFKNITELKKYLIINYPVLASGKNTKSFWLCRGYNIEEAKINQSKYKITRDVTKSPMNIEYWINKGYSIEDANIKIKSQRKMNIEYWLSRGYNLEDAKIQVKLFQSEQSIKIKDKKILNPDKYNFKINTKIEYWINKGYTKEEAKQKLSERQHTFSLQKCIDKYGEEIGNIKWLERQNKWQQSLKISKYDGKQGKSIKIKDKIIRFNKDKLINSIPFKNKHKIYDIIINSNNIQELIDNYIKELKLIDEITLYKSLKPILNTEFFKIYYNVTREQILSLIIPKLSYIKTKFGNIRWFNNHICRSDGEYIIAKFLFNNHIKYVYEKYYNKEISKYRTDFYLVDYDYYIEYMGIRNYDYKKTFLNNNNINNVYFSNNIKNIKIFINKIINENNNK